MPNDNVCIAHSSLVLFTRFVFIFDERTHRFLHNLAPTGQTTKPDGWIRGQGDPGWLRSPLSDRVDRAPSHL